MGVIVREGRESDAPVMISFMQRVFEEGDLYLVFEPGEFEPTVESEEAWVREHVAAANSLVVVAVSVEAEGEERDLEDGEMLGILSCTGGRRQASRHETTLGITVKKEWRGRGVGRAMMGRALEWARQSGVVKRVQLEVLEENVQAQKLYEELGFEVEGVRRRAFRKWGRWANSVVMGLLID